MALAGAKMGRDQPTRRSRTVTEEEVLDRIEGLFAYDGGSRDSGVKDDDFKYSLQDRDDIVPLLTKVLKRLLACDAYGIEDAKAFLDWVEEELEIDL